MVWRVKEWGLWSVCPMLFLPLLLLRGKIPQSPPLLQRSISPTGMGLLHGPQSSQQQTALARPSLRVTAFFVSSHLLWHGFLHRLQVEFYPTVDLSGWQGLSLPSTMGQRRMSPLACLPHPILTDPSICMVVSLTSYSLRKQKNPQNKRIFPTGCSSLKYVTSEALIDSALARGRSNLEPGEFLEDSYRSHTISHPPTTKPPLDTSPTQTFKVLI